MLGRMKGYEHCLLERQNQNLNGQVHNLDEPHEEFDLEQDSYSCELAYQVVDACLVELNMLESPPQTSSWFLNSRATHHVFGDP